MSNPGAPTTAVSTTAGAAVDASNGHTAAVDLHQYQQERGLYLVLVEEAGSSSFSSSSSSSSARLFLGTQTAAQDRQLLRRHGISRIVCVGTPAFHQRAGREDREECHLNDSSDSGSSDGFVYLEIPVLDLPSENLLGRLDACVAFVGDGMRRGQGVLVNCVFAQSRSAAGARMLFCYGYST